MTAPPWGHKPPPVDDPTAYWNLAPPEPSPRCAYWLARHQAGTWRPNRRTRAQGYMTAAEHLGIWIWEYRYVILPLWDEESAK